MRGWARRLLWVGAGACTAIFGKTPEFPREPGSLPRLRPAEPVTVHSGSPVELRLNFGSRWKLHPESPSWMALFERVPTGWARTAALETQALRTGKAALPVTAGREYRLQGILYYCKTDGPSLCWIQSEDRIWRAGSSGKRWVEIRVGEE